MAQLPRRLQKLFGSAAGTNQLAKFGSLAAGSPARYSGATVDPDNIQLLANYLTGWFGAVLGSNSPAIEDMNALCYLFSYQLASIFQDGISRWETGTTYFKGSRVTNAGIQYTSLTDSNQGNAVTDATKWLPILSAQYDLVLGSAAEVTAGVATHSAFDALLAASVDDQVVRILPGTYATGAPWTISKRLKIVGAGYASFLNGAITVSSASGIYRDFRSANDITFSGDTNFMDGVLLGSGASIADNGNGNLLQAIQI